MILPPKLKSILFILNAMALGAFVFGAMPAHAVAEADLPRLLTTDINIFYLSGAEGNFAGQGGVPIAYRLFRQTQPVRGTVIIASGFSETIGKFAEVAYDFYHAGYSVLLFDHRGQGLSGHFLADPHKAEIDDFENLVKDLKTLKETVGPQAGSSTYFLLAHSMGGAVAARYLEEYPHDFSAAVLSAPMLTLRIPLGMNAPAFWLTQLLKILHWDQIYVRGPNDPIAAKFEANKVTHSAIRFQAFQLTSARLPLEKQIWGLTAHWVGQAMAGGRRAREAAEAAVTPLLLLQAEDDQFVAPQGQDEFCKRAPNCTLRLLKGSRHELFLESDPVRADAMKASLDFFSAH